MKVVFKYAYLILRNFALILVSPFIKKNKKPKEIKTILIYMPEGLGDSVYTLEPLTALKENFPEATFTFLIKGYLKDLISMGNLPCKFYLLEWPKTILIKQIRLKAYDLAIDFTCEYKLWPAIVLFLSRVTYKVGFDIWMRGIFFEKKVSFNPKAHMRDIMLSLLEATDLKKTDKKISLEIPYEKKRVLSNLFDSFRISKEDKIIVIHPGARFPSQCWSYKKFAHLADKIIDEFKVKVVFIGLSSEANLINNISSLMKNEATECIGQSLFIIVELLKKAEIFIGNNSGPLHLAVYLDCPTLSFMGPSLPWRWKPLGENHIFLREDLKCSPCNQGYCRHQTCLEKITVHKAFVAFKELLKRTD
jgi:ADP-heptose:LPS heptosyltransferase